MATTVLLVVTPRDERKDPNRLDPPLPSDLAALLSREGVPLGHGWSRHGQEPWRMLWHLSGPERVMVGRRLETEARRLGYEADLRISP